MQWDVSHVPELRDVKLTFSVYTHTTSVLRQQQPHSPIHLINDSLNAYIGHLKPGSGAPYPTTHNWQAVT